MEISRENILEIMNKSYVHPSKDYGQNFLVEPTVSKRIVDALVLKPSDKVLEIGPGLGSLTHFLSLSEANIDLVDIDFLMTDWLKVIYQQNKNIKIITNDVRKVDVSSYNKIIGNLPYNITTELIIFLLLNATSCNKYVLMCQSETFEHFYQTSGSEYGPTSVLIHLLGDVKKVLTVKAGSFVPAPKCSSTVFEINRKENADLTLVENVYLFTKMMFLNRRKTLLNNLINYLHNKELSNLLLEKCDIKITARPEEINPELYLKLFNELKLLK